jgi:predicted phosphodiesterase
MLLCVFGDVHGNAQALEAVLEDARHFAPELYVCTGDVVPGLGSPCATVDAVVALGAPWVTGNGEQWVLDAPGYARDPSTPQGRMVAWTREQLGPERLARLRGLPQGLVLRLGAAGAVWVAHGAPPDTIQPGIRPTGLHEWTGVLEDSEVARTLGEPAPGLLLCGHTHIATVRRIGATLLVNPGSTGMGVHPDAPARYQRGNAWARYALLRWSPAEGWRAQTRRVPYPVDAAQALLDGLPWADAGERARLQSHFGAPESPGDDPT